MKILNFGSCNIDYVYSMPHFVSKGETMAATQMEIFAGGKGLNQTIAVARSGSAVYHAGCLGEDGGFLKELLQDSGADVSYLQQLPCKNGHAIIQLSGSDNCIIVYKGTNGMISGSYVDQVIGDFSAGDFIILQNEINDVHYVIDAAHRKGMRIVLNPSPITEDILSVDLGKISYLILNEVEAKAYTGTDNPKDIIKFMREKYPRLAMVLTLGSQGCIYADAEQVISQPAFMVEAVDTTAAGDTFTGYFISMIAKGNSPTTSIKYATAASAVAVSAMGAAPSIPTMAAVKEALKTLRPNVADKSKDERLMEQIGCYIEKNLKSAKLQEAAEGLGYSASYIATRVHQISGETFTALVRRKRCEAAAEMLRDGDESVGNIIHTVGYENESFFRQAFREYYGVTPLEYRKKERGKTK